MRRLPLGPALTDLLKHELKKTNPEFRRHLPRRQIERFADARFAEGADTIFMGHFHRRDHGCRPGGKAWYVLPAWFSTQEVTVYQRRSRRVQIVDWRQLNA